MTISDSKLQIMTGRHLLSLSLVEVVYACG